MNVCLIGLGHWGKNHARVLGELKKNGLIDELFFYDIDSELVKKISNMYGGIVTEDPHKLDLDAVDIVVPANLHYKVAKPFIEKGINTFIEKPFTDNVEQAQELIDISESPNRKIMVGHIFRFHSGVQLAKELVNKGAIGNIKKIDIRRLAFAPPKQDNGVIYSLAIHDLDLFRYFSNEMYPIKIQCISSKVVGPTEDHAFIHVQFDEHVGIAEESWMSPSSNKVRTCSIQGSEGEIFFDFSKPSEVIINSTYLNGNVVSNGHFNHTIPFKEPLSTEISHFIESTQNKKEYLVGPKIGLESVVLCEQALQSSRNKSVIDLSK